VTTTFVPIISCHRRCRAEYDNAEVAKQFDAFCFATFGKSFEKVIIEAMVRAKLVAASRIGGSAETFQNQKNGILLPPRRPDLLAREISSALENEPGGTIMGAGVRATVIEK
jgi:glycosyltransferase involved in cell wall biosynthesis